jgi:hypothetical protein
MNFLFNFIEFYVKNEALNHSQILERFSFLRFLNNRFGWESIFLNKFKGRILSQFLFSVSKTSKLIPIIFHFHCHILRMGGMPKRHLSPAPGPVNWGI